MSSTLRPQIYVGCKAPNFQVQSSQGIIDFYDYIGDSWCLFFSHPADFTPVCTTEIGALASLAEEFAMRRCKLLGLSTNNRATHVKWLKDIERVTGFRVDFPLVCDVDRRLSTVFGMLDARTLDAEGHPVPLRSTYFVDPNKVVRLVQSYPLSTGRNTAELLRCLDSLQLSDATSHQFMTPVNWIPGDDVVLAPDLDGPTMEEKYPEHRTIRDYLRLTPFDPDSLDR
ncbi:AaceriACL197Wp [[Ashbya] aceris (nom. inval.)]|nr:AaceriACL197Wp [[Ashbya] aceris (nom. inval.)]